MNRQENNEKPEVYAIRQDSGSWQISRRDFLKAAGISAAALGTGLNSRFVRPAYADGDMASLCSDAPAHKYEIVDLVTSADGRYLISLDKNNNFKCWDFENFSLISKFNKINGRIPVIYGGFLDGEICLYVSHTYDPSKKIIYIDLPEMKHRNTDLRLRISESELVTGISLSRDESIYAATDGQKIYCRRKKEKGNGYQTQKELNVSENGWKYVLCGGEQKLAVGFESDDFGTIDLSDGTIQKFETPKIRDFAILPGEADAVLIEDSDDGAYRLVSLIDGMTRWKMSLSGSGAEKVELCGAAVAPDGSMAVLIGKNNSIRTISTMDGSIISSCEADLPGTTNIGKAAVSGDGSKMAIAVGRTILFFGLPDLTVIGCPIDLDEMSTEMKAVEISKKDPVTGQAVTYSMPCGSPIPAGAVCTCNCVAGKITPYSSCGSNVGHYWHPN